METAFFSRYLVTAHQSTWHHFSILKIETIFFSRKLVPMNQSTRCHIPETRNPICSTRLSSPYVVTLLSYPSS
jgi:hypothetical protein